jgi:hypothetical protein
MAIVNGITTAAVKVRTGPGTENVVIAFLVPKTPVEVFDQQGDWLHVQVAGKQGYVHGHFVLLADQGVPPGFLVTTPTTPSASSPPSTPDPAAPPSTVEPEPAPEPAAVPGSLADVPLEPSPDQKITLGPQASGTDKLVANTWNKFGGLITALSEQLQIDPAVAVAVLAVESGGRGFSAGPDGAPRMIIRFENHIFFDYWGKKNPDLFNQLFHFNATKRWTEHQWRPAADQPWRDFHGTQNGEWDAFSFARTLSDTSAKLSISMGGPQIMGFNYSTVGYESVNQMFEAFAASERDQVIGFFDFVQGPSSNSRRILALQAQDFNAFASLYNGPGQASKYGSIIRSVFDTFHKLKPA